MNANKRGVFSRELIGSNFETKQNKDERRVNMYRDYESRGLPIPFHLANNEEELSKYSTEEIYAPREDVDTLDDVLDSLNKLED